MLAGWLVFWAVWTPMKAMRRNMNVPQNSPNITTSMLRVGSAKACFLWPVVSPWAGLTSKVPRNFFTIPMAAVVGLDPGM